MPTYDFKCEKCNLIFEEVAMVSEEYLPCPKCKIGIGKRGLWTPDSFPSVVIGRKHQSAPKDFDTHPLDEGIPFGEVPGDEQYEWLHDGKGKKYGPVP